MCKKATAPVWNNQTDIPGMKVHHSCLRGVTAAPHAPKPTAVWLLLRAPAMRKQSHTELSSFLQDLTFFRNGFFDFFLKFIFILTAVWRNLSPHAILLSWAWIWVSPCWGENPAGQRAPTGEMLLPWAMAASIPFLQPWAWRQIPVPVLLAWPALPRGQWHPPALWDSILPPHTQPSQKGLTQFLSNSSMKRGQEPSCRVNLLLAQAGQGKKNHDSVGNASMGGLWALVCGQMKEPACGNHSVSLSFSLKYNVCI